eukprot:CAMPEP_0114515238 /NCGR_PEP_ID=MMETSP0109-20121206/16618_1 /TAXON_ID=29199 /ORGANISM="Chlorarachnion reptans, Strain CCCM449" /LENGTH=187 /DNA_ID=CAMNT_0001695407 /DNA_START=95 /DNA_END=658 /DNA_ORIENTATION=-
MIRRKPFSIIVEGLCSDALNRGNLDRTVRIPESVNPRVCRKITGLFCHGILFRAEGSPKLLRTQGLPDVREAVVERIFLAVRGKVRVPAADDSRREMRSEATQRLYLCVSLAFLVRKALKVEGTHDQRRPRGDGHPCHQHLPAQDTALEVLEDHLLHRGLGKDHHPVSVEGSPVRVGDVVALRPSLP